MIHDQEIGAWEIPDTELDNHVSQLRAYSKLLYQSKEADPIHSKVVQSRANFISRSKPVAKHKQSCSLRTLKFEGPFNEVVTKIQLKPIQFRLQKSESQGSCTQRREPSPTAQRLFKHLKRRESAITIDTPQPSLMLKPSPSILKLVKLPKLVTAKQKHYFFGLPTVSRSPLGSIKNSVAHLSSRLNASISQNL